MARHIHTNHVEHRYARPSINQVALLSTTAHQGARMQICPLLLSTATVTVSYRSNKADFAYVYIVFHLLSLFPTLCHAAGSKQAGDPMNPPQLFNLLSPPEPQQSVKHPLLPASTESQGLQPCFHPFTFSPPSRLGSRPQTKRLLRANDDARLQAPPTLQPVVLRCREQGAYSADAQ
ncbi:hypothetical protein CP532_4223 [Ophiocordyceps camponoti-leonardi (nom. inval.)]|nr:hypothetical protein CP532_4223 [Ophiocordyceps camponoti-leonardi (nom. inval.)]